MTPETDNYVLRIATIVIVYLSNWRDRSRITKKIQFVIRIISNFIRISAEEKGDYILKIKDPIYFYD